MSRLTSKLRETFEALATVDLPALERLRLEVADLVSVPLGPKEFPDVLQAHRRLGALLRETERNLRLFRMTSLAAPTSSNPVGYPILR